MRIRTRLHILFILTAMSIAGCTDDPLPEEGIALSPETDMSKFWYSRSRSPQENGVMMRHHALGFSYQAISGEKCNIGDVMCQVLNLDYLERNRLSITSDETEMVDSSYVQRGVADYVHGTSWESTLSADLVLYQGEKRKQHFLIETINDSTLIMNNSLGLRSSRSSIRLDQLLGNEDMPGELSEHPEEVLSENFRYALSKLKTDRENVAVIDSFLNIFGTHVVTRVDVGGTCNLSVKTSKRFVSTYLEEQEYSKDAVNLFFKKMESVEKLSNQTSYKNLFKTAEIDLKVRGGDLSHFDRLIANPSFDNAQASYENFDAWAKSLTKSVGKGWDEGAELIDMAVTPIYKFIPDEDLAKRVKVRMEASAQDMRDLYGDRNFTNAVLTLRSHTGYLSWYGFQVDYLPKNSYSSFVTHGILHVIQDQTGAPSKVVAVTYREYIPEFEKIAGWFCEVYVTYPVYENRIQMTEGIAMVSGVDFYRVKWLYDRYEIEEVEYPNYVPTYLNMYLYNGRLFFEQPDIAGEEWRETKVMPDYEWAGSINSDGSVAENTDFSYRDKDIYWVIKLFDKFYLYDNHSDIPNLPGWHYNGNFDLIPAHYYNEYYNEVLDLENFYWYSDIGEEGTANRMVRNDNFRYSIIPAELYSTIPAELKKP